MGYRYAAATVLALAAVAFASPGSNTRDGGDSPLLVPLVYSRNIEALDARQGPLLARLTRQSPVFGVKNEAKSLDETPQETFVKVILYI